MQIIIAGFHRSGTSLLTQLLHAAGLFVGDDLLGAGPSNRYGHLEDRRVLSLHRAILERHGDDWQWDAAPALHIADEHWRRMRRLVRNRELEHRTWGFKDPRVCLFLGAWKHVNPDAKFVMVYRDPGESVRSMEARAARALLEQEGDPRRHGRFFTEPDHGLRVWDTYNRHLVSFASAFPDDCLVIPFTRIAGGDDVVAEAADRWGLDLDATRARRVFDPEATSRREAPQRYLDEGVATRVRETWAALETLAERTRT